MPVIKQVQLVVRSLEVGLQAITQFVPPESRSHAALVEVMVLHLPGLPLLEKFVVVHALGKDTLSAMNNNREKLKDILFNTKSCARHGSGYRIMKKKVLALFTVLSCLCVVTTFSTKEAQASETSNGVCAKDTHCTKCGTHNGRWRCPSFCPEIGRPTDCQCGHEKKSHIGC